MDPSAATRSELTSDRKLGGLMSGELGGLTGALRGGAVAAALSRGALFIISRGTRRMSPRRRAARRTADRKASVLLAAQQEAIADHGFRLANCKLHLNDSILRTRCVGKFGFQRAAARQACGV